MRSPVRRATGSSTDTIQLAGVSIGPGERRRLEIPVARLVTQTMLNLPVTVVRGERPGPVVWMSAAIHGDELNGAEIIRRVLEKCPPGKLAGTLLAVPVVNVYGFLEQSRYLPDRRDLNRSFPGSPHGSLASRLAHLFLTEIVQRCSHGIDLHTGSNHRMNVPQIRANLDDPETLRCAKAFAAPLMIHAATIRGSLREAAAGSGITTLVYETGEPLRFDPEGIAVGVDGVLRVLAALGMRNPARKAAPPSLLVRRTRWVRAARSGIFHSEIPLGSRVVKRERLGVILDVFGDTSTVVTAPGDGVAIGLTNNPLVNRGDALVHLAEV